VNQLDAIYYSPVANICNSTTIIKESASAIHSRLVPFIPSPWGLSTPKQNSKPAQVEMYNTLNQWSLCQILECQSPCSNAKTLYWRLSSNSSWRFGQFWTVFAFAIEALCVLLAKTAISYVLVVFQGRVVNQKCYWQWRLHSNILQSCDLKMK